MSLKISLFRGTDANHKQLHARVPQQAPRTRQLILLAVIHDEDAEPRLSDTKVMLYQELLAPDHYWIRKENTNGPEGRTNYSEADCGGAAEALNGFEISTNMLLSRLVSRNRVLRARSGPGG